MSAMGPKGLAGFVLLGAAALTGAVWLGFGDLPPGVRTWLPVSVAALAVAGSACLFFSRPEPDESVSAMTLRDIAATLKDHREQLERIAILREHLGTSLERLGEQLGDLGGRLDRHGDRLERLAIELVEAGRRSEAGSDGLVPPSGQSERDEPPSRADLPQELKEAWKRYRDGGDGHFNAPGFKDELANAGIDLNVRRLDGAAGSAVLTIDDPWAGDRSFFVVPDFNRSPKSAEHWFEDESSRRLGGRTDKLRKLARGKWSQNGPEVVEKGSVA